jgi:integrase
MARVLAARAIVTVAGELTPPELTIGHVVNAHAEITTAPYAANTRYLANSELRRTLLQLQAHGAPYGLRDSVPRLSRPAPRPVTVDADTIGNILSLATPAMQLFVLLCHDCALRSGTAAKIRWANINGDRTMLTARTKRGAVTRVPISGRLRAVLDACPEGDAPLLALLSGHSLTPNGARAAWHRLLKKSGVPDIYRPHDLRRTVAEQAYKITGDLRVVQTLLGHDSLKSTLTYLQRPSEQTMQDVADTLDTITGSKNHA